MKRIFRKLRSKKGLTLVEMLVCVGMMAIIGAMISTITALGAHVYADSNFVSESQTLASTMDGALNDMLSYATDIHTNSDNKVTGFNVIRMAAVNVNMPDFTVANGGYLCYTCNGTDVLYYPVQPAAYGTIQMSEFKLTYSGGIFTATFKLVSGDPALAGSQPTNTDYTEYTFTYRPILNQ